MRSSYKLSVLCVASVILAACSTAEQSVQPTHALPDSQPQTTCTPIPANLQIETMSLEQKVGQLFIIRPDTLDPVQSQEQINDANAVGVTELSDAMCQVLAEYHVGGVCQFGKNIASPEQITRFNADLQAASEIPLFIAVDEEGGTIARLANNNNFNLPRYENAAAVAADGTAAVYQMGKTIGKYLKDYGFTMDFAPVADVNTNPENPVIGTRAFSAEAEETAQMASAMASGLQSEGILPTFKHFPGHGDTAEDTHTGAAYTSKTLEQLQACELLPFETTNKISPHAVMVAHIAVPNVTGDDTPASLSEKIVDLIPNSKNTLIITDSLAMQAITNRCSAGEAAVMALQAGCDILLMPNDLDEAYHAVLNAVQSGELSQQRLDQSVEKILRFKQIYCR